MHYPSTTFIIGLALAGLAGPVSADKAHRLAYSPKLGVEVLAKVQQGLWCRDKLQLQIVAKDASLFQDNGLQSLMSKLGAALTTECAAANQAAVEGYVTGSKTPLYRAEASKALNWALTAASPSNTSGDLHQEVSAAETNASVTTFSPSIPPSQSTVAINPEPAMRETSSITEAPKEAPLSDAIPEVKKITGIPGKLLPFAVGDWMPPPADAPPETFVIFSESVDFPIVTPQGECKLHVPPLSEYEWKTLKENEMTFTALQEFDCKNGYVQGRGKLQLKDKQTTYFLNGKEKHYGEAIKQEQSVAAFSQGYFTGEQIVEDMAKIKEFDIKTKDGKCAMHYSDVKGKSVQFLHIEVTGADCPDGYVHGQGRVALVDSDGNIFSELSGAFSHGYFTKDRIWDVPFTHRFTRYDARLYKNPTVFETMSADWLPRDYIAYPIASDAKRKIHFFGLLRKSYDAESWDACSEQPTIVAVTAKRELFFDQNDESAEKILRDVMDIAFSICPSFETFYFYASEPFNWHMGRSLKATESTNVNSPNTPNVFYTALVGFSSSTQIEWGKESPKTLGRVNFLGRNLLLKRYEQKQQIENQQNAQLQQQWIIAFTDFIRLQNASRLERLGYLINGFFFDEKPFALGNAPSLAASSTILQKDIETTLLLHVDDINGDIPESDWPTKVKLKLNEFSKPQLQQEGWYIVHGNITGSADDSNESDLLVGTMDVGNVIRCEKAYCNEVNDLLSLVQKARKLPDWNPAHFDDYNECSGEGCNIKGMLVAKSNTVARQNRSDTAKTAFDINKGEKLLAMTGVAVTTDPVPIKVLSPLKIGDTYAQPGDIFYETTYEGEGFVKAIFNGKLVAGADMSNAQAYQRLKPEIKNNHQDWLKIYNAKGQAGWIKADSNLFWGTSNYDDSTQRAAFDKEMQGESHE